MSFRDTHKMKNHPNTMKPEIVGKNTVLKVEIQAGKCQIV